jgi:transcriptional regulator with XRE-family HTH domain
MNYIKENRTELQLTQCELVSLVNYNLSELNSLYRLSQSRLSFLERLSTNELLTKLNVLEYKQLKTILKDRLNNKNSWYYRNLITVNGKRVSYKGIDTWLQRFTVNGLEYGFPMDLKPTKFKQLVSDTVDEIIPNLPQ